MRPCPKCRLFAYCAYSEENCEQEDWKFFHRHECPFFLMMKQSNVRARDLSRLDSYPLSLRLYLTLRAEPLLADKQFDGPDDKHKSFNELTLGPDNELDDQEFETLMQLCCTVDPEFVVKGDMVLFKQVFRKVKVYATRMHGYKAQDSQVGTGIAMQTWTMRHDCRSNCMAVVDSLNVSIAACRNLDRPDDERTVNYLDFILPKDQRRALLFQMFGFWCECDWCERDESAEERDELRQVHEYDTNVADALAACRCRSTDSPEFRKMVSVRFEGLKSVLSLKQKYLGPEHVYLALELTQMIRLTKGATDLQHYDYYFRKDLVDQLEKGLPEEEIGSLPIRSILRQTKIEYTHLDENWVRQYRYDRAERAKKEKDPNYVNWTDRSIAPIPRTHWNL